MSSYWDNKWASAKKNWEELQSKRDSADEVLAGLSPSAQRSYGIKQPKGSKDFHQLLKSGNVGKSIQLTGGIGSAQVVSLLDVRGPDEYAQMMTVTLDFPSIAGLPPPTFGQPFIPVGDGCRAQVDFGVGGFQSTAFVDFGRGVSFSLPASYVRVNASREGTTGALVLLTVGAHIAYGSVPLQTGTQPTLTLVSPFMPAGTFRDTLLPPFAVAITPTFWASPVIAPPPAASVIGLVFFSRSGAPLGGALSRAENPIRIPIPAETTRIRIVNLAGIGIETSSIYSLGL